MNSTINPRSMIRGSLTRAFLLPVFVLGIALPPPARAVNSCNSLLNLAYIAGPLFAQPGDILRVRLTFGAGSIQGGTTLTLKRVRFDLDCNSNFSLGLPCTDEGLMVEYEGDGTITDTCGGGWTTGHAVSGAPNEVVLTPGAPLLIPANTPVNPGFCHVDFDVKVLAAPSIDVTPTQIEEVAGFSIPGSDATCDTVPPLTTNGTQTGAIQLCPVCNDNNDCTTDTCDGQTGQCVFTNKPNSTPCGDTDGNACTFAGCNGLGVCDQLHQQTICQPDNIDCTFDPACNTTTGQCDHPAKPDSTPCADTDGNLCTFAGCTGSTGGAFLGCDQNHIVTPCPPDSNECTNDPPCDPGTGLCTHPNKPDSTTCTDTDGNACTFAGCEAGACVQTHQTTVCTPDANECTDDPACNPGTGLCTHPNKPDSTTCTDTDGNACTFAGCEAGACIQTHQTTVCTPDNIDCSFDPPCNTVTGTCDHPAKPASTPCADTDGNLCTFAGCTGSTGGAFLGCDQNHIVTPCPPDGNECTNDPPCNPTNGLCEHPNKPASTPCTDTDGNLCTQAGCEANPSSPTGAFVCSQTHMTTVCPADPNPCLQNPGCNPGTGLCPHPPVQDSTPCPDTTPTDQCTAGCEAGTCIQTHANCVPNLPPLHHMQCYEIRKQAFAPIALTSLKDQFLLATPATVNRPDRMCAPADKLHEDPSAPLDPIHLTAYKLARKGFVKLVGQKIVNQFHPNGILVDVIKPERLMVPSTKSFTGPPAPPVPPTIDHFQCYKVKVTPGQPKLPHILVATVTDQLSTYSLELTRPIRLCAPADKNNETQDAFTHDNHLFCYKTKAVGLNLNPFLADQFGTRQWELIHRREFCVPSLKNP